MDDLHVSRIQNALCAFEIQDAESQLVNVVYLPFMPRQGADALIANIVELGEILKEARGEYPDPRNRSITEEDIRNAKGAAQIIKSHLVEITSGKTSTSLRNSTLLNDVLLAYIPVLRSLLRILNVYYRASDIVPVISMSWTLDTRTPSDRFGNLDFSAFRSLLVAAVGNKNENVIQHEEGYRYASYVHEEENIVAVMNVHGSRMQKQCGTNHFDGDKFTAINQRMDGLIAAADGSIDGQERKELEGCASSWAAPRAGWLLAAFIATRERKTLERNATKAKYRPRRVIAMIRGGEVGNSDIDFAYLSPKILSQVASAAALRP